MLADRSELMGCSGRQSSLSSVHTPVSIFKGRRSMETSQRTSLKFENELFISGRYRFGADNDHCAWGRNSRSTSWKTKWSLLFSPLQLWPRMGKRKLNTWSPRERSALWPRTFECQRVLKWRSSPVSLTSAFPATTNRGTRKSATRCVRRLCSGSVWASTFASRVWIFLSFPGLQSVSQRGAAGMVCLQTLRRVW